MKCGYCKSSLPAVKEMLLHWKAVGCPTGRPVWEKVVDSRKSGHSGRRLLHEAWPRLWPFDPMGEEDRERLRERDAARKADGVKRIQRRKTSGRRFAVRRR